MTDIETMRAMLKKANIRIDYEEKTAEGLTVLSIMRGYVSFFTDLTFNPDGSLNNIEAYE